jgi:hypothetical protein
MDGVNLQYSPTSMLSRTKHPAEMSAAPPGFRTRRNSENGLGKSNTLVNVSVHTIESKELSATGMSSAVPHEIYSWECDDIHRHVFGRLEKSLVSRGLARRLRQERDR